KVHQFDYATKYFEIKSSKQWLHTTTTVGQLLEIHYPNQVAAMGYLQGLQIFLRSMAVVIPLGAHLLSQGYLIPLDYLMPMGEEVNIPARQEVDLGGVFGGSVGGIGVLSFIGSVFVGFYLHARVLFEGYILCISRGLRDREHAGIFRVLKEQREKGN
ncbi:MAG TPA: hypothetical protein VFA32_13760, partial [Dehalococcoidia bacterium]|nr:hypothetical protein [Dehalococcoidia bacterium]